MPLAFGVATTARRAPAGFPRSIKLCSKSDSKNTSADGGSKSVAFVPRSSCIPSSLQTAGEADDASKTSGTICGLSTSNVNSNRFQSRSSLKVFACQFFLSYNFAASTTDTASDCPSESDFAQTLNVYAPLSSATDEVATLCARYAFGASEKISSDFFPNFASVSQMRTGLIFQSLSFCAASRKCLNAILRSPASNDGFCSMFLPRVSGRTARSSSQ